ncbi:MAG: thioredoxin-disulfide reductase [Leptospirales bacterium]|nr:thioredoxin-disulfide reductase [Leptospirales bacterium]
MKDLIIIGGGPAGLTAGIYGIRAGLDLIIIERIAPGGQVVNSYEIENYPGFPNPISGWDLMDGMEEQTRRLGAEIISGDVVAIKKDNNIFTVVLSDGEMQAKSVIIATGTVNRKLNVPGEKEYTGRGVSYCATCDGAFFKEKVTVVVGGGDAALEEADFLTRFASKVYLIHRRDQFRGSEILQKRALSNEKIIPILNTVVESINGDDKVNSVLLKNKTNDETKVLNTDGVFVFVGFDPNVSFVDEKLLNANREIIVDMNMQTAIPGLFAAGDIRSNSKRQIVTAAADGATAALNAYEYLIEH